MELSRVCSVGGGRGALTACEKSADYFRASRSGQKVIDRNHPTAESPGTALIRGQSKTSHGARVTDKGTGREITRTIRGPSISLSTNSLRYVSAETSGIEVLRPLELFWVTYSQIFLDFKNEQ